MKCKCSIDNIISYICKNEYDFFFSKKNVVGVGLGYKSSNGFFTSKKCIVVFVTRKCSLNNICIDDVIPTIYKGILTDVVESGELSLGFSSLNNTSNPFRKRVRPVLGGYSIGVATKKSSGSMGCLVTDNHDTFLLSCNHILAYINTIPLGTFVLQPSTLNGGKSPDDAIAFLAEYIPINLEYSAINIADCAVAKVMNKANVSSKIALVGTPKGVISPKCNMKVRKVGETTGFTTGKINAINSTCRFKFEGKNILFGNQIFTSSISEAGDSGAILLSENNYAVGLVMGGSPSISICNTFSDVLQSLNMLLVTK